MPYPSRRYDGLDRLVRASFADLHRARPSKRVRRRVMAGIRRDPWRGRPAPGLDSACWLAPPTIRLAAIDEVMWGRGRLAAWWLAL